MSLRLNSPGMMIDGIVQKKADDRRFGLIVAVAAFLVYASSLGNGFVWDDAEFIVYNPALWGDPVSLFIGVYPNFVIDAAPYYRPLTLLTFLIENRLYGLSPSPMHLVSVLLHAANAFLVYRLAIYFVTDRRGAFLAGLLFAVHPVNSEAVDFISTRNDLLATFFVLTAFILHLRSVLDQKMKGAIAGSCFLFAGLLSKENALAILPVIVLFEVWSFREKSIRPGCNVLVARLAPYAAATAGYLMLRTMALPHVDTGLNILADLPSRLLDNLYIIPRYLLTLIRPTALVPVYFLPEDFHLYTLPLIIAWLCIIVIIRWLLTRGGALRQCSGLSGRWYSGCP